MHVLLVRLNPDTTFANIDRDDVCAVEHVDAHPLRRCVVGVHQRFATTEKKRVRPRQVQRTSQRCLKADAVPRHPLSAGLRSTNEQPRQRFVCLARVHAQQVGVEFVLGVRLGKHRRRCIVRAAEITRVPAVAAAKVTRRAFEHDDARARLPRRERRTERGISPADHHDVVLSRRDACGRTRTHRTRLTSHGPTSVAMATSRNPRLIGRVTKTEKSPSLMATARRNCSSASGPSTKPSTAGTSGMS